MSFNIKKFASATLAMVMLTSTLTACGSDDGDKISEDDLWYNSSYLELAAPYSDDEVAMCQFMEPTVIGDDLYLLLLAERNFDISEAMNNENFDISQIVINSICKYDMSGNFIEEIPIENPTDSDVAIISTLDEYEGKLKLGFETLSSGDNAIGKHYEIMDPDTHQFVDSYDIDIPVDENTMIFDTADVGDYQVVFMYVFGEGSLDFQFAVTEGGRLLNTIDVAEEVPDLTINDIADYNAIDDHTIAMMASTPDGIVEITLDVEAGTLTSSGNVSANRKHTYLSADGGSFAIDTQGIWTLDESMNENLYIPFTAANVNVSNATNGNVVYCDGNKVIIYGQKVTDNIVPDNYLIVMDKADSNPNAGKSVLKICTLNEHLSYAEAEAICRYNNQSEDYFAQVMVYESDATDETDYGSINSVTNQLMVDLIAGEGPDVVLNGCGLEQLNNPEYFVDMNEYLNGSDGVDSSALYADIISANTSHDGKLYQLPLGFNIRGIMAPSTLHADGTTGFTFDEYNTFVNDSCNGHDPIGLDKTTYLIECLSDSDIDYIVDGQVNFDSAEFRALAQYCHDYVYESSDDVEGESDSTVKVYDVELTSSADYILFYQLANKTDMFVYGYPAATQGTASAQIECSAAISAVCDDDTKEAAWDFVKVLLSDDIQKLEDECNPISKEAFQYVAMRGLDSANSQYDMLANMGYSPMIIAMFGLSRVSEDVVNGYIEVADSINRTTSMDTAVSAILSEEMGAYFSDQKSLDDVISIVNNRAQTIVSERGN